MQLVRKVKNMKKMMNECLFKTCKHASVEGERIKCNEKEDAFWGIIPCYLMDERTKRMNLCPKYGEAK